MDKARKILLAVCVLVMANMIFGCEADKKTENNVTGEAEGGTEMSINLELTDRQKKIAEIEGWPQNYIDMDTAQETTIYEVELAYQYIEKKYPDDKFEFCGIHNRFEDVLDYQETALLVKSEKLGDIGTVVVWVSYDAEKKRNVFHDNYEVIIAMEQYKNDMIKCIKERKPEVEIKVYADNNNTLAEGEDINTADWIGNVVLIMPDSFESRDELEQILEETVEIMAEKYTGGQVRFVVLGLANEDFQQAEATDNYANDYIRENVAKPIYYYRCGYDEGKVIVERKG